jgi:hypothetical protein
MVTTNGKTCCLWHTIILYTKIEHIISNIPCNIKSNANLSCYHINVNNFHNYVVRVESINNIKNVYFDT